MIQIGNKWKRMAATALACMTVVTSMGGCSLTGSSQRFTVNTEIGIDGKVQAGEYAPVAVNVTNNGRDFTGKVQIIASDGTNRILYEKDLSIGAGASKTVSLTIPVVSVNGRYNVRIVNGKESIQYKKLEKYTAVSSITKVNVGILSDDYSALGYMDGLTMMNNPNLETNIVELGADDISTDWRSLDMLDVIVISNYSTDLLTSEQISALRYWVEDGGLLMFGTGSTASKTLSGVNGNLFTVNVGDLREETTIYGVENYASYYDSSLYQYYNYGYDLYYEDTEEGEEGTEQEDAYLTEIDQKIAACNYVSGYFTDLQFSDDSAWSTYVGDNEDGNQVVMARYQSDGNGYYMLTTYDLTQSPLPQFEGAGMMFLEDLELTAASTIYAKVDNYDSYYYSYNSNYEETSLIASLSSAKAPSLLLYGILLFAYVITVPVVFIILRKKKKSINMWLALPITVAIYCLLIYIAGFTTRVTRTELSVAKILQLDNGRIDETDYVSALIPNNKGTTISFLPNYLVDFVQEDDYYYGSSEETDLSDYDYSMKTSVTETEVKAKNNMALDYESISLQKNDSVEGSLDSDIHYTVGKISGTITNNLPYDLTGATLLVDNYYFFIGDLKMGETVSLDDITAESRRNTYNNAIDESALYEKMIPTKKPSTLMTILLGSLGNNHKKYQIANATLDYVFSELTEDSYYYNSSNMYGLVTLGEGSLVAFPDVEAESVQSNQKWREYDTMVLVTDLPINKNGTEAYEIYDNLNTSITGELAPSSGYHGYSTDSYYDYTYTSIYYCNLSELEVEYRIDDDVEGIAFYQPCVYGCTFYGEIYAYNYDTLTYDVIMAMDYGDSEFLSRSELDPYLETGVLKLQYVQEPNYYSSYEEIEIPALILKKGEAE